MNVLIYDTFPGIAHLASSVLRAQGCRVSVTTDPQEARRRLSTSLFDAMVLGPSGAPCDLADFIEEEFPSLPLILAGVPNEMEPSGQISAVLAAPLSAEKLASAFRLLAHRRRERLMRLPAEVSNDGVTISCRLADLDEETLVLAGESEEFHSCFGRVPRRVRISILDMPIDGEATRTERLGFQRTRRVDIQLDQGAARGLYSRLMKRTAS